MTPNSSPRSPYDIVGFDLDGTLLDTSGDITAAVNHALESAGRDTLSVERVRTMIGGGSRHMLAQGLAATGGWSEEELDTLQRRLLDFYADHIAVETHPFPHCLATLDALAAGGARLAVVTNKTEALATKLLAELGLTDRFVTIIGGDTLGPGRGKPSPAPIHEMIARCGGGRAAFVGDSIYDVEAAHAAGLKVVACSFGFLDRPVTELGADAVIDDYAELWETLAQLAG
jgi:phosphoglycolate phosphatase